jgi:hypothetical protein
LLAFPSYLSGEPKSPIGLSLWVRLFSALTFLIVLPISLLLLIFRKSRAWGGLGIYLISWPLGLWLWLVSLLYALGVSVFWAVAGVLMGGLGVIPVAAIMTLLRRDWGNFGAIVGNSVVVILLRWLGLWIVNKAAERDIAEKRGEPLSPTVDQYFEGVDTAEFERDGLHESGKVQSEKAETHRAAAFEQAKKDFDRAMRELESQAQQKPERT